MRKLSSYQIEYIKNRLFKVKLPALPRGASVVKPSGTPPKPPDFAHWATSRSPHAIPPRAPARGILAKASEVRVMGYLKDNEPTIEEIVIEDLDAILRIDKKIRKIGEVITYKYTTTESILTIDRIGHGKYAKSYADMIAGDISGMLNTSLVAKIKGKTAGFIISRKATTGDPPKEIGMILIMGVDPKYWRKGIASKLIEELVEKYKSMGIKELRIPIDERDMQLRDFFTKNGFRVGHLIEYSKKM
jgi:GNAT superfamily N-acetyltransferase